LKDPNRKGELQKDSGNEDLITINSTRPPSDVQACRYCCIWNSSDRHKRWLAKLQYIPGVAKPALVGYLRLRIS